MLQRSLRGVFGILLLVLTATACGGDKNPIAPTPPQPPPAAISGNWSGTWESSNYSPRAVLINVTQTTASVSGTWATSPDGWNGTLTGTVDASSFTGTLTFNAQSLAG